MIKAILVVFTFILFINENIICEDNNILAKGFDKKNILKDLSISACECIDSINTLNKSHLDVSNDINKCIDDKVDAYQLMIQLANTFDKSLSNIDFSKKSGTDSLEVKSTEILLNTDKSSKSYKKHYFEIEEYLMENCLALKSKIGSNDEMKSYSISENNDAQIAYTLGIEELVKNNYKEAIVHFQKAVDIDQEFPFAWDNLGICYRKLNNFDKAIECYKKSLNIDPFGMVPLQNMAVAYQHKNDYDSAIEYYKKMSMIDDQNPEVYYGISICYFSLENNLKSLDYMCKAYNLYIKINSPYRVDAQKVIASLYHSFKEKGNLNLFNETLEKYKISVE